jgi:hypothetical protein
MKDLVGKRFGSMVVLAQAKKVKKHIYWKVQCDCGSVVIIGGVNLQYQDTCDRSCPLRAPRRSQA